MDVVFQKRRSAAVLLLPVLMASACGGGSSGGSTPPPPPPPATAPPSVSFDITQATVLSGGSFANTVGGTIDDRAAFTIDLACTNGVEFTNDNGNLNFTVPAETDVAHATCTARVTDAEGRSASQSLAITILPKTSIGQVVGIFNPALKLVLPNFNIGGAYDSSGSNVTAIAPSPNHPGRYKVIGIGGTPVSPLDYYRDDDVRIDGDYASIDFVQSPSLAAHGLPTASMSIASVSENKVYWLAQELQSKVFSVHETIDVPSPCFVAQTNTFWGNDMVVGQRDHGLSVFDIDTGSDVMPTDTFNWKLMYSVGEGRSLCHMLRGVVPESVISKYPGFQSGPASGQAYAVPLTAIDYKTNELVFYGDINGDNVLDEMGTLPIETHSTGHLDIVQVISRGTGNQIPQYMLVLLSDGKPQGEHRLVQINFDPRTTEITQRIVHEWGEGVPVSMAQGQLGGSLVGGIFRSDLVVVLGTTEKSFFFDNLLPLEAGFGAPPVYGEPQMFDVGLGAGSAVAAMNPMPPRVNEPLYGVMVSYPDSGRVIFISLPFTN